MTRKAKAIMWWERVTLRGIEGIISDDYLLQVVKGDYTSEDVSEAMRNHLEAKYMAEQVYAQAKGWGL